MTFEEWAAPLRYAATLRDAYLAGQASADSRIAEQLETIKALNDCIGGKGSLTTDNLVLVGRLEHQIAELERERDVWKRKAELPMKYKRMTYNAELQKEIEALKAQAGEPDRIIKECNEFWGRKSDQDFDLINKLQNRVDVLTAALEYHQEQTRPIQRTIDALSTHPTTERPYNPLNDYAVISMNPTEPVKAQAGEPIYGMAQQRQLNPSPQVRSDVGGFGDTNPTTERRRNPMTPAEDDQLNDMLNGGPDDTI